MLRRCIAAHTVRAGRSQLGASPNAISLSRHCSSTRSLSLQSLQSPWSPSSPAQSPIIGGREQPRVAIGSNIHASNGLHVPSRSSIHVHRRAFSTSGGGHDAMKRILEKRMAAHQQQKGARPPQQQTVTAAAAAVASALPKAFRDLPKAASALADATSQRTQNQRFNNDGTGGGSRGNSMGRGGDGRNQHKPHNHNNRNNNGWNRRNNRGHDNHMRRQHQRDDGQRGGYRNDNQGRQDNNNNNNSNYNGSGNGNVNTWNKRNENRGHDNNRGHNSDRNNHNPRMQQRNQPQYHDQRQKQAPPSENRGGKSSQVSLANLMAQIQPKPPPKNSASGSNLNRDRNLFASLRPQKGLGHQSSQSRPSRPAVSFQGFLKKERKNDSQPSPPPSQSGRESKDANAAGRYQNASSRPTGFNHFNRGQGLNRRFEGRKQALMRNGNQFLVGRKGRTERGEDVPSGMDDAVVTLPNYPISLVEVSTLLRIKQQEIKRILSSLGETQEEGLDVDLVELLALELGVETQRAEQKQSVEAEDLLLQRRAVAEEDIEQEQTGETGGVSATAAESSPTAETMVTLVARPPVVCIMGHVDHGKTTLMDALRQRSREQEGPSKKSKEKKKKKNKKGAKNQGKNDGSSNVAGTEAGGITQVISAFQVSMTQDFGEDKVVTFLDTPGHAAFKAMRQSGSHAADVIVLVVAADDGVSEQTVEILNFYKSIVAGSADGGITMVVALNKIDKHGVDVDEAKTRVENQLMEHGIFSEGMTITDSEFGPPVQIIPTSGLTGLGLEDLMEGLVLQSEMMDLRADDKALAEGIVMDARIEKGHGVVADCIIRWGSMKKNDVIVSGDQTGRVRLLKDVNDKMLKKGDPSMPVRIVGFKSIPKAGDPIICVDSEEEAEEIIKRRMALDDDGDDDEDRPDMPQNLEVQIHGMRKKDSLRVGRVIERANIPDSDGRVRVPIIVKAEAEGSLVAIRESLVDLGNDSGHPLVIDPVYEGVGAINESDIQLAKESEAPIFAFGLKRIDQATRNAADDEGVQLYANDVIYTLLDQAKDLYAQYLPLMPKETVHGTAIIKAVFEIDGANGKESIAGMQVQDGTIFRDASPGSDARCYFRVLRDGAIISPEGDTVTASSLRHFKDLVDSVERGNECGLGLSGFEEFKAGDVVECFSTEMKQPDFE